MKRSFPAKNHPIHSPLSLGTMIHSICKYHSSLPPPHGMQQPYDKVRHSAFSINTPCQAALFPVAPLKSAGVFMQSVTQDFFSSCAAWSHLLIQLQGWHLSPFLFCLLIFNNQEGLFFVRALYPFSHTKHHTGMLFFLVLQGQFLLLQYSEARIQLHFPRWLQAACS